MGDLLLTLLWGDLLLTRLWEICCWRATGCATLLYGDSSFAQPMWLCSCCQIIAPIIPSCPSMMGVVVWQQLQSHIGCAKLLSPYKSVAQPVALQQQISP